MIHDIDIMNITNYYDNYDILTISDDSGSEVLICLYGMIIIIHNNINGKKVKHYRIDTVIGKPTILFSPIQMSDFSGLTARSVTTE